MMGLDTVLVRVVGLRSELRRSHAARQCWGDGVEPNLVAEFHALGACPCVCDDHPCQEARRQRDLEQALRCPRCRDHDYVREAIDDGSGVPKHRLVPCPVCYGPGSPARTAQLRRNADASRIHGPQWWTTYRFSALIASPCPARDAATHWVGNADLRAQYPFLVLYGSPGTGKTHSALAALDNLLCQGIAGYYLWVPDFLDRLRAGYRGDSDNTERADTLWYNVQHCPLLVIDDIGAQKTTEYVAERLTTVVNLRLSARCPTIITTNWTPDTCPDARLASRIFGHRDSIVVDCSGPDRRQRPQARLPHADQERAHA